MLEFLATLIQKHSLHNHHSEYLFNFKALLIEIFLKKLHTPTKSWLLLNIFYESFTKITFRQRYEIFWYIISNLLLKFKTHIKYLIKT